MILWLVLILLCFTALAFVIWPLYQGSGRLSPLLAVVIVLTIGLSATMYHHIGRPGVPSGAGSTPDVGEMVASLAQRLEDNPDDINGWLMLGRSYQTLQRFDEAASAYEKAIELEQGRNAHSMVALGVVLLERQDGQMSDRAASLFENALVLDPNNPNALFYGGGAAARRGNTALAADRWETLMGLNAPLEIQGLLQSKINEWRGLPPPVEALPQADTQVSINLSVAATAMPELPADATVYVIARDPGQPSPPIAVTPRRLSELPALVVLSDRDAMVPGRSLSGYPELEIVARISLSGNPIAQSGDWAGSTIFRIGDEQAIDLVIDTKIP